MFPKSEITPKAYLASSFVCLEYIGLECIGICTVFKWLKIKVKGEYKKEPSNYFLFNENKIIIKQMKNK